MRDATKKRSPIACKLESIHQRMADVSEEEAQAALLSTEITLGATAAITLNFSVGQGLRYESVLTRTA